MIKWTHAYAENIEFACSLFYYIENIYHISNWLNNIHGYRK